MKIGVVSAHYMPEAGYQEVHLSRAYARLGYEVKVFTSTASVKLGGSISKYKYHAGLEQDLKYGYEILRLPTLAIRAKAFSFGLQKAVNEFNPDVLIILGVAKIFPTLLFNNKLKATAKIISIYGDAAEYYEWATFKQKIKSYVEIIGHKIIKRSLYKKALKYCDKIILNYPETANIFLNFLNEEEKKRFELKKVFLNLGYDSDEYFFNEKNRRQTRKDLNISDDEVVLITSTRINKRKNLEEIIQCISTINQTGKKVKYILVGFLGDTYEKELKTFIKSQPMPNLFLCFPFLDANAKRELYCAADVAIWQRVSISIKEAMGTGLPIILENKLSMSHLIKNNHSGWFFEKEKLDETLKKVVNILSDKKVDRPLLASENAQKFSYDNVAKSILQTVRENIL
jgi:glycosyltransferase involved in cell wall biosynthesis